MNNDIQVSKEHYDFFKYVNMNRWCSYYTQIEEIIKNAKKRIMIIGIGDGITIDMTKRINEKLELIKVDFDKELRYNDYHRFYLLRNRMEKGISEERTSVCSTHQL